MKKFLSIVAILSLVFSPVTPAFAADLTLAADNGVWADATGAGSGVNAAVAGDNVDLDDLTLDVTNNQVADDGTGGGSFDDFTIGDITDGSAGQTGAVLIYAGADSGGGFFTVNIHSVAISGDFTVESAAAFDCLVETFITDSFNVGGNVMVNGTAGGYASIQVDGAVISATSFVLNDNATDHAYLDLGGPVNQDVTGTIDGAVDGEGIIEVDYKGNGIDTTFNSAVGSIHSLFEISLFGDETTTFASTVAATTTVFYNDATLSLGGHLTGNIDFAGNQGTVLVGDGVNIIGAVDDASGPNNGTLTFLGASTISNAIGASNALMAVNIGDGVAVGGIVTMGNDISATTTIVESGATLQLNGNRSITGDLTLADNLAAGNGGALDLQTYTLALSGLFTFDTADTTLQTTLSGSTIGSLTAGTVDVQNGNLVVTLSGVVTPGTYTVVTDSSAAGAVNADSLILTQAGGAMFTVTIVPGAAQNDLQIVVARVTNGYQNVATDGNSAAVGSVLDGIAAGSPTGDMATVINTLDLSSTQDQRSALATMTPDMSSGSAEASHALTNQGFTMVSNRLGGARSSGFMGTGVAAGEMLNGVGVWIQGLGSHMKQDARKGIEGYKANLFGTTIGADRLIDRHFRAGLAGSYGWARVNSKTPGSPSDDINSYQATVYGSYDSLDLCDARKLGKNSREAVRNQGEDFWYVDGMAAFTQNNYDSRREIWLTPATKRVAKADHYAQQYSTNFETGYTFTFEETKALEVTPFAGLGYNYLYMNKYKEKGADSLNLTVNGEGFHQLEQSLGTKLAYPMVSEKAGTFIPSVKAAWLYDYIGDRFETTASFAGGGTSFNTQGAKPAKNGMLFGAELAFLNKGNMTVTGNWDIELKDQFMSNTYYGTVRYDF